MGLLGDRKPKIESLAREGDAEELAEAALYEERKPGPSGGMRDFGVPIRAEAIAALGALGPDQGQEAVELALRDPAERVRVTAIRVLHGRRKADVLARALRWLPGGESQSRKFALRAVYDLRELASPRMVAEAMVGREDDSQLGDDDAPLIAWLIEEQRPEQKQELTRALVSALGDSRTVVADRAAELLVELAPSSSAAVLAELEGGSATSEAAWVLGQIGDPETLDALMEGLAHEDPATRRECAAALGALRDPLAVRALLRATRDPEHSVRIEAGDAIDQLGNAGVILGVAALLRPAVLEAPPATSSNGNGAHPPRGSAPRNPQARSATGADHQRQ